MPKLKLGEINLYLVEIFLLVFFKNVTIEPQTVYTVYLDGRSIGNIVSKKSFEDYINVKEEELKNNKMIEKVSQEANGLPTFGHLSVDNMFGMDYEAVKPEDIPNFLDESWAIKEKVDDEKDEDK